MPVKPDRCFRKCSNLATLLLALAMLLPALSGCADDRVRVDRTLDAREQALNAKDVDAYMTLFGEDYVAAKPGLNLRKQMQAKFDYYDSIYYESFGRNVTFEGEFARVIQEYKLVTVDKNGRTDRHDGVDHFMLRRHGTWPFAEYLFYTGLDGPAPQSQTPAPTPTATPAPKPGEDA